MPLAMAFIFWEAMTIGGSVYLYFFQGASGWWVALGITLGFSFSAMEKSK
jgi:hypothetical protein